MEIYAEVHFQDGSLTSAQFFDLVPHLKTIGFEDVQFGRTQPLDLPEGRDVQQVTSPHVRCWSEDKRQLVQLFEDMIAVNLIAPYPGWSTYRSLFGRVRDTVITGLGMLPVESLSLNTIDRLVAPRRDFRLGRYLNCGGPKIPASCSNIEHAFDLTLGIGLLRDDGFNRQIRLTGRPSGDTFAVFLDAVFHDRFSRGSDLVQLLDALHEESVDTFECMITDVTREEVMGGAKNVTRA